ncbi:MAG: ABC transporter substrate-binding protein, partial [Campylobacterota bacterium]|nr:ABC transporter substrate-binding protein [Campylobacterota bacterium]
MNFFKITLLLSILFLNISSYAGNQVLEKVTLQLQWKHQFEFAGFYAAKEKGFYADAGLDVTFVEFNEHTNITGEVLNENAQYGLSYSSIIAEYLNGKPLVLLANFFKQSPLVLVAQAEIKTPADLKGKKVMGISNTIDNITLWTMLNKFNVQIEDIDNIRTNFSIDDFVNKKVDAMSVFTTNELYQLEKKGIKYNIFDPVSYGAKYYDVNLFTTQKELSEHPHRVKAFAEASIKGWEYALSHQEELIEVILKKYNPQHKSKEALEFEARQIEYIMLPDVHKVGSIDTDRVKMIAE